ncbi:MAG: hypothetical protein JWR84_402 [Caulobacter sp.]|nr:hypothetical protein [Caulobacter sp.]
MVMPRDPLTSPARTRNDRRLRNRFVLAFLVVIAAGFAWTFLTGLLPAPVQEYGVGILALLVLAPAYAFYYWKRADWQNRATTSKDDAHSRKERAKILGGDDQ